MDRLTTCQAGWTNYRLMKTFTRPLVHSPLRQRELTVCVGVAALPGDTALHIACSSACPGMQLVSALVAAGADPLLARSSDGSTPLLLAAKAGGQVGLELAKALLQGGSNSSSLQAERRQQQQQASDTQATGTLWCRMDVDSEPLSQTSSSSSSGLDAANAAGETAVGVAAAAVLASVNISGGQAGSAQGPVAGSRAAASSAAQQELLMLLLDQRPSVPQQLSSALLQQGLSRNLPDSLTAKVCEWRLHCKGWQPSSWLELSEGSGLLCFLRRPRQAP